MRRTHRRASHQQPLQQHDDRRFLFGANGCFHEVFLSSTFSPILTVSDRVRLAFMAV